MIALFFLRVGQVVWGSHSLLWHPVLSSHCFATGLPATQSPVSFLGYPEPEVTWYKDDIELDRYCGLPKYEITHQGNRHTLHIYRWGHATCPALSALLGACGPIRDGLGCALMSRRDLGVQGGFLLLS